MNSMCCEEVEGRIYRNFFEHKRCGGGYCLASQRILEIIKTTPKGVDMGRKLRLLICACYAEVDRGATCAGLIDLTIRYEALYTALFGTEPAIEGRPEHLPETWTGVAWGVPHHLMDQPVAHFDGLAGRA